MLRRRLLDIISEGPPPPTKVKDDSDKTTTSPNQKVNDNFKKAIVPYRSTQIIDLNDNILGAVEINGGNYFVANKKDKITDVCLIPVNDKLKRVAQFIKDIKSKTTEQKQNGGKTLKRKNQRHKRRNKTAKQI